MERKDIELFLKFKIFILFHKISQSALESALADIHIGGAVIDYHAYFLSGKTGIYHGQQTHVVLSDRRESLPYPVKHVGAPCIHNGTQRFKDISIPSGLEQGLKPFLQRL